jgi:hypothetical protein
MSELAIPITTVRVLSDDVNRAGGTLSHCGATRKM